jgi:hypothetical protein
VDGGNLSCSALLGLVGPSDQLITRLVPIVDADGRVRSLFFVGSLPGPSFLATCEGGVCALEDAGSVEAAAFIGSVDDLGPASGSLHFVGPLDAASLFPYAPPDPSGAYLVGATQLHDPNGVPLQGLPSSGEVTAVAYDPEYDRLAIARKDHLVLTRTRSSTTFLEAAEIPLPPEVTVAQLRFDTFGTLWLAGTATGDFVFSGASVGLGGAQAGAFLLRLQPDDDNTVEDPVEVLRVFGAKAGTAESSLVVRDLELSSSEVLLLVTARNGRLDLPAQPDPAPDDLGGSYLLRFGCF